jgi:hypothetical protein
MAIRRIPSPGCPLKCLLRYKKKPEKQAWKGDLGKGADFIGK